MSGAPPLIILMPGFDGTGRLFDPLLECAPDGSRFLVIRYEDDYSTLEQHVGHVMNRLPQDRDVILVAESFSSLVALRMIENADARIQGVLIVAGFIRTPVPYLLGLARLFPPDFIRLFSTKRFLTRPFFRAHGLSGDVLELLDSVTHNLPGAVIRNRFRIIAEAKNFPSFQSKVPMGYLRAKHDLVVHKSALRDYQNFAPDLFVREVSGPHFILQAQPRACYGIIEEFCSRVTD
ncbi:MAG: alpha/beta hydrolase [Alphaproteobacteria bacterium]|nr:alpha/beta hydrolase [Alphaproteobacteria bacterium]MCB9974385.1 alpha/beta hydrolase [Rhodospirillales bacterium]